MDIKNSTTLTELRAYAASHAGSVLLEESGSNCSEVRTRLFTAPQQVLRIESLAEVKPSLLRLQEALNQELYIAGFLAYEAGYAMEPAAMITPIPAGTLLGWFGVYGSETTYSFEREQPTSQPLVAAHLPLQQEDYSEKIAQIRNLIEAGDIYQANFTQQALLHHGCRADQLFAHMMTAQPVAYGALLRLEDRTILSASPELFFRTQGKQITVQPMKGTAPRGGTPEEDERLSAWLQQDEKNRSENLMIVDLLRNDLGRICMPGSVRASHLFEIIALPSVFQMISTVNGRLRETIGLAEIFAALFPSGSITGAPKIRAMQILQQLEEKPRGVYTGAIGYMGPEGNGTFNVAIRTAVLEEKQTSMGVGSGIVYDSDAIGEYKECQQKLSFLTMPVVPFQVLETMLWDRDYLYLDDHLQRMANTTAYFGYRFKEAAIRDALNVQAREFGCSGRQRVRLLLDRDGTSHVETAQVPDGDSAPVRLLLAAERTQTSDVFLFHKTTHRPQYNRVFQQAQAMRCTDALFRNQYDEVTEGCIHSLFFVKDGRWYTPALQCGLLPGIERAHLIRRYAAHEIAATLDGLLRADEIYLCNSVRGLRRVEEIIQYAAMGLHRIWPVAA